MTKQPFSLDNMAQATITACQQIYSFKRVLLLVALSLFTLNLQAQDSLGKAKIRFSGQLSAWGLLNPDLQLNTWLGARYIPQLNLEKQLNKKQLLDAEVAINGFGTAGFHFFDSTEVSLNLRPYRVWLRYSTQQMELRAGLQKINFGSATLLRPLSWFDQVDPRDPLGLTDGAYGLLFRYYLLDNSNIWLWSLMANNKKGFEQMHSAKYIPEIGGRYQRPIKRGEAGISYHFRMADTTGLKENTGLALDYHRSPESRLGLDARWDLAIGMWAEGSWIYKHKPSSILRSQLQMNVGIDYTIAIGNGLAFTFEQYLVAADAKALGFNTTSTLSALNVNYPVGMFDTVSGIFYYDWTNNEIYNTLQYTRDFNKVSLYLLAFWNPKTVLLPQQEGNENLFGGKGLQVMVTYKH